VPHALPLVGPYTIRGGASSYFFEELDPAGGEAPEVVEGPGEIPGGAVEVVNHHRPGRRRLRFGQALEALALAAALAAAQPVTRTRCSLNPTVREPGSERHGSASEGHESRAGSRTGGVSQNPASGCRATLGKNWWTHGLRGASQTTSFATVKVKSEPCWITGPVMHSRWS
jgi:hypothetical protein